MKDIEIIKLKNGRNYSIRSNRDRYFYPDEWFLFYNNLKPYQRFTFDTLINTGARINEARHIKFEDFDNDRNTVKLKVTKTKSKKKEKKPRPRTIPLSSQFMKKIKKLGKDKDDEEYIKILSTPASNICLKKTLQRIGIKDYYMFSIHNIRKTHGNWLKALGVGMEEICLRLGHDADTYLKSYGSPNIFNNEDIKNMRKILGDLYENKN